MQPDRLSATFSALADPTRRAILARLTTSEASVNELAEPFDMSLPAVSKHLKVLEKAGLIARSRSAQWRPCRLEAEPLKEIHDWVAEYRRFWEQSFDRLDDYLRELQARDTDDKDSDNKDSGIKDAAANRRRKKGSAQAQEKVQKGKARKRGDK